MDGGNSFPQHQQPGDAIRGIPGLRSQLVVPDLENPMLAADSWSSCYSVSFPTSSFPSENQQYFSPPQDFYMDSISRPHFLDTNYAAVDPTDFLTKNGDFPQDSSYLDELSNNNSLFSSPPDSLSEIADPKDFLPADSLSHVPTLWDVNTPQQNQIEPSALCSAWAGGLTWAPQAGCLWRLLEPHHPHPLDLGLSSCSACPPVPHISIGCHSLRKNERKTPKVATPGGNWGRHCCVLGLCCAQFL